MNQLGIYEAAITVCILKSMVIIQSEFSAGLESAFSFVIADVFFLRKLRSTLELFVQTYSTRALGNVWLDADAVRCKGITYELR